jgi:hypothetical protein
MSIVYLLRLVAIRTALAIRIIRMIIAVIIIAGVSVIAVMYVIFWFLSTLIFGLVIQIFDALDSTLGECQRVFSCDRKP